MSREKKLNNLKNNRNMRHSALLMYYELVRIITIDFSDIILLCDNFLSCDAIFCVNSNKD